MENHINEPQPPLATPRPCSTPHSAPVEWLKEVTKGYVPEGAFDEGFEWPPEEVDPEEARAERLTEIVEFLRSDPRALAHVAASLAPEDGRSDGWTPFARRLFLEVLSETGRVTTACEYAQLTKQSAYALRARDPLFAASWDAACEIAPAPLADALYERAIEGVTETVTRDGKVVATRHRRLVVIPANAGTQQKKESRQKPASCSRSLSTQLGSRVRGNDEIVASPPVIPGLTGNPANRSPCGSRAHLTPSAEIQNPPPNPATPGSPPRSAPASNPDSTS